MKIIMILEGDRILEFLTKTQRNNERATSFVVLLVLKLPW